jgi:hypothetical protein
LKHALSTRIGGPPYKLDIGKIESPHSIDPDNGGPIIFIVDRIAGLKPK